MRQIPLILLAAALAAAEGGAPPPGHGPGGERRGPGPEELFQRADADKDGRVTLAELTAALAARIQAEREAMFARLDADSDGVVTKAEFLAFEPPAPPGPPGQAGKDGAEGKPRRRGPDPAEMMKRLDRNGDGAITADELKRPQDGKGPHNGTGPPEGKGRQSGDDLLAP